MSQQTRTGEFGIGFRLGWSDWQKDISAVINFAVEHEFACIDLGRDADLTVKQVTDAGLGIGSVDLKVWQEMIHPDADVRKKAVADNSAYIEAVATQGAKNFFLVMGPADAQLPAEENWGYMIESYRQLAPVLEQYDAKIVIEGYPCPGCLVVAPESYRAFFDEVGSPSMGFNFDPSHLLRMGIDPIRAAREFVDRIFHVHAKDTEIISENAYECGFEHFALKTPSHQFGKTYWRYTIPGHGQIRWVELFKMLAVHHYQGFVSVELEDEHFNGTEAGEKQGLLYSQSYLQSC